MAGSRTSTKTPQRRPAAKPAAKAGAPPKPRSAQRRPPPRRPGRIASGSRRALAPHMRDIQGVALALLAFLLGLAVWLDQGGKLGQFAVILLRGLFGLGAFAVPVLVLILGVALIRRSAATDEPVGGRVGIGLILLLLGALGLLHLIRGAPALSADVASLQRSGGAVGALTATPLASLLSVWGAGAVFLCLFFLGALITTKTPISAIGRALKAAVRAVRGGIQRVRGKVKEKEGQADGDEPEAAPSRRGRTVDLPSADGDAGDEAVTGDAAQRAPVATRGARSIKLGSEPARPVAIDPPPAPQTGAGYTVPPVELLRQSTIKPAASRPFDETARLLEDTLHQFDVDAIVPRFTRGPTVTRYEVEIGQGTKVNRVIGLSHDIAYALASPDVRIIAPIPGKSAIGIEVPNRIREPVTIGDIFAATGGQAAGGPLTVALGKDISGEPVAVNLAHMPHVLIAGSTGSGKSVCLNVLVTSLLMRNTPEDLRLLLIDPKRVELTHYEGVPHLITPVVTNPRRAGEALSWVVREMEMRLETLAIAGVRNIAAYNEAALAGTLPPLPSYLLDDDGRPAEEQERQRLPYIVVVIDELADLMMIAKRDVEDAICRIAQMARAVGIHLVIATQRPSVDVITGLIKANIPSRIAFMMATVADSRVVLDTAGADKLVGQGDMLYLPGGTSKPARVQGAFITEKEIETVVAYCKAQQQAVYKPGVVAETRPGGGGDDDGDDDPLLTQAMEIVVRSGLGSTSMLQSKMKIGFARARRVMDQLEERGIVGPSEGSKPRDVLMSVEELDALKGREDGYGDLIDG